MGIEEKGGYLFCITGLPGNGKSTVANILVRHLRERSNPTVQYATDWIKDHLYPELLDETRWFREWGPDEFIRTYNGLYMLIDEVFKYSPLTVVTDGTFRFDVQRARLREIALQNNRRFNLIKVNADEEIVVPRLEERFRQGQGDGVASYYSAKNVYEEPTGEVFCIDNDGDLNNLNVQIEKFVSSLY